MKTCSHKSIVRGSGIYDVVILLPFAIPGVVEWTMLFISNIHHSLFLQGSMPTFSPFHFLFINVMAIVSIVWSVIRIMNPLAIYGWYDTVARILIAITMLVYLVEYQVSQILWVFIVAEVAWATLQINGYFSKYKRIEILEPTQA